jgi:hypothetical protein
MQRLAPNDTPGPSWKLSSEVCDLGWGYIMCPLLCLLNGLLTSILIPSPNHPGLQQDLEVPHPIRAWPNSRSKQEWSQGTSHPGFFQYKWNSGFDSPVCYTLHSALFLKFRKATTPSVTATMHRIKMAGNENWGVAEAQVSRKSQYTSQGKPWPVRRQGHPN